MKIEIRNVKHAEFASEETECFEATVYIDGAKAGTVANEGHGGSNNYHPFELESRLNEHGKTLPSLKTHGMVLEMDADLIIGELFERWQTEKELRRLLKNRILFTRDGKLMEKKVEAHYLAKIIASADLAKHIRADKVLNQLPFEEALQMYQSF